MPPSRRPFVGLIAYVALGVFGSGAAGGEPLVQLELVTEGRGPIGAPQRWLPILDEAGFSQPTIRGARDGDRLEIVTAGSAETPIYRVRGVLTAGGQVKLPPGREFSYRDKAALKEWVQQLKHQGPESAAGGKTPFGLVPSKLEEVKRDLARPVASATRGTEPLATLEAIAGGLQHRLVIDEDSRKKVSESGAVRDELRGLASGTAMAALVRPAGLVFRPRLGDGEIQYVVLDGRGASEHWPLGWTGDKSPGKLVPGLFAKIETQDAEVELSAALAEVQGRVAVPFLFDYNNMALHGVDLTTTKVTMKAGKTYYGRVLSRVLNQARLVYEPRLDDAGQPFLWITTTKR